MDYGIGLRVRVVKSRGKASSSRFSLGKECWAGDARNLELLYHAAAGRLSPGVPQA